MVRNKQLPLQWLAGATRAVAEDRKSQRGKFHILGTPKSHVLPHIEASTFIAPCSLVLLPGVDVGWSSVHSLCKASQIYIPLFCTSI